MTKCYYRRLGPDTFESTDITCSNWDPAIQHGSPPLALLTKAIEAPLVDSGLRIGRLTLDILGAIPVAPVRV
ncbi:MAG TPA: acyl-CoA thioesterase domain-containing protein, partial [Mycobacterium sp.]|nr:acyl-CoA thioesterase domain-containing protein [Mycobacterium sp.]